MYPQSPHSDRKRLNPSGSRGPIPDRVPDRFDNRRSPVLQPHRIEGTNSFPERPSPNRHQKRGMSKTHLITTDERCRLWDVKQRDFNINDLKDLAEGIYRTAKKNNKTIDECLDYFDTDRSSQIQLSEFQEFCKSCGFMRTTNNDIMKIFLFIDADDKGYIAKQDIRDFVNKYSVSGGDISQASLSIIPIIERAMLEAIDKQAGYNKPRNMKEYFLKVTNNKNMIDKDEFHLMMSGLRLPKEVDTQKIDALYFHISKGKNTLIGMYDFLETFDRKAKEAIRERAHTNNGYGGANGHLPPREISDEVKGLLLRVSTKLEGKGLITDEEITLAFDTNNSGVVTMEEFSNAAYTLKIVDSKREENTLNRIYRADTGAFDIQKFLDDLFFVIQDEKRRINMSSQEALENRNVDGYDNYKGQGTRFDLKASMVRLREAFIDSAYRNKRNLLDHFDVYDYEGHGNYEFTDFKTMLMELNMREYSDLEMKDMMDYLDINGTG